MYNDNIIRHILSIIEMCINGEYYVDQCDKSNINDTHDVGGTDDDNIKGNNTK